MNGTVELVGSVPEAFADLVTAAVAGAGDAGFRLVLSGGATAAACYAATAARGRTPGWERVEVFLGDERCVPEDDPDANHRMVAETLLAAVGPVAADHPMYPGGRPAEAAEAYDRLVAAAGPPDLVHLGLGPDGHTASLFPGSAALLDPPPGRLVVANTDPAGVNPHERLTLTLAGIARARLVVVTVAGPSKHAALARIVAGEDLPGGRVDAAEVRWLVDAAALGDLRPARP